MTQFVMFICNYQLMYISGEIQLNVFLYYEVHFEEYFRGDLR